MNITHDRDPYSTYRCGWNWRYVFAETMAPSGAKVTEVQVTLLYKRNSHTVDLIVSGFPYGGHREDVVVDAIRTAIHDLYCMAQTDGVNVTEAQSAHGERFVINAPIDSEIVTAFAAALSRIRRVYVSKEVAA